MSNKSSLYQSAISAKQTLLSNLKELNDYLVEGTAKSVVIFYGKKGQVLSRKTYESKYSTSIGRARVTTMHQDWIDYQTKYSTPIGTTRIKVTSPFVTPGPNTVTVRVPAEITVLKVTV
jgi:hypothetical protein